MANSGQEAAKMADSECMCSWSAEQVAEELKRRFAAAGISKGDANTEEMRGRMLRITEVLYLERRYGSSREYAEEVVKGWKGGHHGQ